MYSKYSKEKFTDVRFSQSFEILFSHESLSLQTSSIYKANFQANSDLFLIFTIIHLAFY